MLTVISLLAGALWIYLQKDTLTVLLANRILSPYALEVISISGGALSFRAMHADIIELRTSQSSAIQRVEQFQLEFEARQLLSGSIQSLGAQLVTLSLPVAGSENGLSMRVSEFSLVCDPAQHCSGSTYVDVELDAIHTPQSGLSVSASKLSSALDFSYSAPELIISVPVAQRLTVDSLSYGNQHLEQLEMLFGSGSLLQANLTDQSISLQVEDSNLAFKVRGTDDSNINIRNISLSCSALDICDAIASISLQVGSFALPQSGTRLSGLGFDSDIELQYRASETEADIEITLLPGLLLTLASADYAQYRIEQLEAIANGSWQFRVDLQSRQVSVLAEDLGVKLPVIRTLTGQENTSLSGLTANLQQLDASLDLGATADQSVLQQLSGSAALHISQIYTTLVPYNLWPYQWDSQLQWSNAEQLRVQLNVLHPDQALLSIAARHSVATNTGAATFTLGELTLSPTGSRLSNYVAPLPFEADLLDGTINLHGNASWQLDDTTRVWIPSAQIRLQLTNLAGFADEIVFAGLDATSVWDLREDRSIATQSPFLLSIRELDPGIPLVNLQSSVTVDTASHLIDLLSPQVEVFGGTASTDNIRIALPQENIVATPGDVFIIAVDAIDIAQVLSLSAYEQVGATGIISGTLPVRLKGLTPLIEGGQLSASQQGGSIRYDQGQSASGNQNLDLVYQALEHYQYDTLSAGVDFDELGELQLSLQMQGQSPNVGQGQRINLNLNISDNIPALLQSLQAADNIAERLQDLLEQQ